MSFKSEKIHVEHKNLTSSLIFTETAWIATQWSVSQLSIMIIYNSSWSILIQWISFILSGDNLT